MVFFILKKLKTMTPKEKALNLCQQFGRTTLFAKDCNDGVTLPLRVAKLCAIISANEVIDALKSSNPNYFKKTYWHPIDYWDQVKEEIERL